MPFAKLDQIGQTDNIQCTFCTNVSFYGEHIMLIEYIDKAMSKAVYDKLADGSGGMEIPLRSKSFLAWIDMKPAMFFTHATLYLLIGADKTIRVVNGNWWPELNGRVILYGTTDKYGVSSPFKIPG